MKSKILYCLKGYKNSKQVFSINRKKKKALLSFFTANFSPESKLKANRVYFKVLYGHGKYNDGFYDNKKDFIQAYQAFTSKPQLDFVEQYWN